MEHLEWKHDYELGIESIDFEHHIFLNLINTFLDRIGKFDDAEMQQHLINELNAYARFHFISEENLMRMSDYPHLAEHHQLHRHLLDKLSSKQSAVSISDNAKQKLYELIEFLMDWFIHHTTEEDKRFAEYLQSTQA